MESIMQRNFRTPCRGITLIELVAALTLSVLLVTATGGVIKSMTQKKKVFADRLEVQLWRQELAVRLRDDLVQSQEIRIGSKSLELFGFCGHDEETGEPTQTPAHVVWLLGKKNGYSILTRTEKPRGGVEELSIAPQIELMALGISSISMEIFGGHENEEKNEMLTVTAMERQNNEPGDWTTMPKVLKLIVMGTNKEILVKELIFR
jgi:type II secretory pathway pseudopilin PulG